MLFLQKQKLLQWTHHARFKMKFYGLSEQRVRRIINSPKRVEEGIAPRTVALMQIAGSKKHPYELWAMIQKTRQGTRDKGQVITVISAWRYPGITKPRSEIALSNARKELSEFSENE